MNIVSKFLIIALLLSLPTPGLFAQLKTRQVKAEPNIILDTKAGQTVYVYDRGILVEPGKISSTDCEGFCIEVCDVGAPDGNCFCGGQTFPCEDIGTLPPISKR